MYKRLKPILDEELQSIKDQSLWKKEWVIESPQGREITVEGRRLLNFCSNNYLGLSGTDDIREAADEALKTWGFGLASVRFICGTQGVHKELEAATAQFLGMDDVVLYSSCFMANVGLFQTFFGPEDAIISDELNHASIIDAVRLTKSERLIYQHMDMADLEAKLQSVQDKRLRVIATDGVFSMDGHIAPLKEICDLADKYNALVMVDDAHATGVLGATGRGTPEHTGTSERIDFLTGTYGKALGGAGGAFTATRHEAAEYLRQRSRTYLFSNALEAGTAGASLFALKYIDEHPEVRQKLTENTVFFREEMTKAGFDVAGSEHPITPIMFAEERQAVEAAAKLFEEGIYVVGFSFPVVPKGKARIRVQISAAHTREDLTKLVEKFAAVAKPA
ncbi:MAG TPA: glycine C-acetyltransferase [Candidatus Saccharimonadales bacterium]|jgi:glycine C-acetyltransferase|nr:glycine C-acetyltransferase [Candidatus Saccharimonadales bacterium]